MHTIADILEIKGKAIYTTPSSTLVLQAVEEMCRHHVGALPVVDDDDRIAGILSERDVMTRVVLERRDPAATRVADVMTRSVICIDLDESVGVAMRIMTERRCRHLPVVRTHRLLGLVSIGDLVRCVTGDDQRELQQLHEYIEGRYPG